jgi:APA family basic amino acid/polyamine antiporter
MMYSLDAVTWAVFGVWMALGAVVYFGYGMRKSRLTSAQETPSSPASTQE